MSSSKNEENKSSELKSKPSFYKDASFVHESEATPAVRFPANEPEEIKKAEARPSFVAVIAFALACALLGGVGGAYMTSRERAAVTNGANLGISSMSLPTATPDLGPLYPLTPGGFDTSDIYALAKAQTVRIKIDKANGGGFGQGNKGQSVIGSGFVVSADGHIVTNYPMLKESVEQNYPVNVSLDIDKTYTAKVVGFDAATGICLLKIDAEKLTPAAIGNSTLMRGGESVYPVGFAADEAMPIITSGIISADSVAPMPNTDGSPHPLRFDAAINESSVGGPLYNSVGEVVGVILAKDLNGLGLAVPINEALSVANELLSKGCVGERACLGINVQTVSSTVASYYNMVRGAYINYVGDGSCAQKAGLLVGDVITELGGSAILSREDLDSKLLAYSSGDTVKISIWRAGSAITLSVVLDEKTS